MALSYLRIFDANLNRFREGLRVVEDYCRFILENEKLAELCKKNRHEVTVILTDAGLSKDQLLRFRDTENDIGVCISTVTEYQKKNEIEILLANFGRVQESLRVLEEFGKLKGVGAALEAHRYQMYTLEKEVLHLMKHKSLQFPVYILLTKSLCKNDYLKTIQNLCEAGAKLFQIREKEISDQQLVALVKDVIKITKPYHALVIVNDRLDIALAANADGVHLGVDDLPIADARQLAGRPFVIGATIHSLEELNSLPLDLADYIGVGPCFATTTKPELQGRSPESVSVIAQQCPLPHFAIGGISAANIQQVISAGLQGVAVCSSIISASNPVQEFKKIVSAFDTLTSKAK